MGIDVGKLRILIPTTRDPVEVMLLTEEDPAIGRCVACIGGTTETADIATAYHAFVVRPTGVIERLFGHSCFRLDVSGRIDAGSSWQLGVLVAHALYAAGRLAQEKDPADGTLWVTGSVRPVDLTVGSVNHVSEKLAGSIDQLKQEVYAGRRVWLVIPDQNTANLTDEMLTDLRALDIEVIALTNVQSLFDRLGMKLTEQVRLTNRQRTDNLDRVETKKGAAEKKKLYFTVAGGLSIAGIALGLGVAQMFRAPAIPRPSISEGMSPSVQHSVKRLVPELVPFISEHEQDTIRDVYMPAPEYKAIALSAGVMRFVTGQPDKATAETAALAACQMTSDIKRKRRGRVRPARCELYASGNLIVASRGLPPMPPQPWIVRDASVETPFDAANIPLVTDHARQTIERTYPTDKTAKALAIAPTGIYYFYAKQPSAEQAIRRSLERCGYNAGVACMIIALDNVFVVPIPKSMKVVGFFHSSTINSVAPELRDEVTRRFGTADRGWSALAVGTTGRIGMKLGATSETEAVKGALDACSKQDRDCRVAAIGRFLVEHDANPQPERSP